MREDLEIQIREERLPGIGHRYELELGNDRRLVVVAHDSGKRDIGVVSGDADVPDFIVSLTPDQAAAVAAILAGARFSFV